MKKIFVNRKGINCEIKIDFQSWRMIKKHHHRFYLELFSLHIKDEEGLIYKVISKNSGNIDFRKNSFSQIWLSRLLKLRQLSSSWSIAICLFYKIKWVIFGWIEETFGDSFGHFSRSFYLEEDQRLNRKWFFSKLLMRSFGLKCVKSEMRKGSFQGLPSRNDLNNTSGEKLVIKRKETSTICILCVMMMTLSFSNWKTETLSFHFVFERRRWKWSAPSIPCGSCFIQSSNAFQYFRKLRK